MGKNQRRKELVPMEYHKPSTIFSDEAMVAIQSRDKHVAILFESFGIKFLITITPCQADE
jgi:hypothetical protein